MNYDHSASADTQTNAPRKISGDEARSLIEVQLAAHGAGILNVLSRYRLEDAVRNWHGTIRAIEEFINVPLFGIKDPHLREWLCSVPLDHRFWSNPLIAVPAVRKELSALFDQGIVQRYLLTMLQIAAIAKAFMLHGIALGPGFTLDTVGAAVGYFQSRRRQLVSLLYTMPFICKGTEILEPIHTLNVLLPQAEHSCIAITGFHLKLAQMEALDDFSLVVDSTGVSASQEFDTLDDYFLEPERASILVMAELRSKQFVRPQMETLDPKKIFSAAELRNSIKLIGATYAAFDLNDSDFAAMAQLMSEFSHFCRDDYFIEIGKHDFQSMLRAQSTLNPNELEQLLLNAPSDYATNTNAYEPFLDLVSCL